MDALIQLRQRLQVLLYMCPHTSIFVLSYYYICVSYERDDRAAPAPPGTTIYVSSYYYACVLILLHVFHSDALIELRQRLQVLLYMCPHTSIFVSSYYDMCLKQNRH
jgi:hypothetical protein